MRSRADGNSGCLLVSVHAMHRTSQAALVAGAFAAAMLLACASAGDREANAPDDAATVAGNSRPVVPDANPTSERATAVDPPPPACAWRNEPARRRAIATTPDPATTCRVVPRKLAKSLRRAVVGAWMRQYPSGRLVIEPGCDRLGDDIVQLDLELSNGHGGNLELVRFTRDAVAPDVAPDAAPPTWSLRWISYHHYVGRTSDDKPDVWEDDQLGKVEVKTGVVTHAVMRGLVDRVRAASALEIHETPPPPRPNTIVLGNMGFSSGSFGAHVLLVDAAGHGSEGFFVGYPGTGEDQRDSVRLHIASEPVYELLYDDAFEATLVTTTANETAVREQFAEFFWAARDRGPEYGKWFLRERFLALASALGDDQQMPELLGHLAGNEDASVARTRVLVINTIAALTGFDRRYADGVARDPDVVAKEVARECGRPTR